jgi:predicted transcriptional regulator
MTTPTTSTTTDDRQMQSVRLPAALRHRLRIAAAVHNTTAQAIIETALVAYLSTLENQKEGDK